MSEQSFLEELTSVIVIDHAAVINFDGDIHAHSPNFSVSANEVKEMISGFADNASLIANGIYVNGKKYSISEVNDSYITGHSGDAGCFIFKLFQTFLISISEDNTECDISFAFTESIAQDMKKYGY